MGLDSDINMVGTDMQIFEAFVPSGSSKTEVHSVGLFTGDPGNIREWVASHSQYWEGDPQPDKISVTKRSVQDIDSAGLARWKASKRKWEAWRRRKASKRKWEAAKSR